MSNEQAPTDNLIAKQTPFLEFFFDDMLPKTSMKFSNRRVPKVNQEYPSNNSYRRIKNRIRRRQPTALQKKFFGESVLGWRAPRYRHEHDNDAVMAGNTGRIPLRLPASWKFVAAQQKRHFTEFGLVKYLQSFELADCELGGVFSGLQQVSRAVFFRVFWGRCLWLNIHVKKKDISTSQGSFQ